MTLTFSLSISTSDSVQLSLSKRDEEVPVCQKYKLINAAIYKCGHINILPENWNSGLTNVEWGKTKSVHVKVKARCPVADWQLLIKIQRCTKYSGLSNYSLGMDLDVKTSREFKK